MAKRHRGRWTTAGDIHLNCGRGALRRTYIYLGVVSARADDVQLLDGEHLFGQLEADVVGVVGLLLVQQSDPRLGLQEWRRMESTDILPSGAITNTMNTLILFSRCAICVAHSVCAV